MNSDVTIGRAADRTTSPTAAGGGPSGGAGELLPHVRSWGSVARAYHAECAKAADAAQELEKRRNGPGE